MVVSRNKSMATQKRMVQSLLPKRPNHNPKRGRNPDGSLGAVVEVSNPATLKLLRLLNGASNPSKVVVETATAIEAKANKLKRKHRQNRMVEVEVEVVVAHWVP